MSWLSDAVRSVTGGQGIGETTGRAVGGFVGGPAGAEAGAKLGREFTKTIDTCLLYTSPSPRDRTRSRMPSSA